VRVSLAAMKDITAEYRAPNDFRLSFLQLHEFLQGARQVIDVSLA
jgi:hypothetical protein